MAVTFKVETTRDFTIMPNHHLKNKDLSLKAKGLHSIMVSLPDNWNYTLAGLIKLSKDGRDSVLSALKELELAGYLVRRQKRINGKYSHTEYIIFQAPHTETPCTENPYTGNPTAENPTQSNTNISNTYLINNLSINHPQDSIDVENYVENFKEQIDYSYLIEVYGSQTVDNLIGVVKEVITSKQDRTINRRKILYSEIAERYSLLNCDYVMYALDSMTAAARTKRIHNPTSYLITTLYNAPTTMDLSYRIDVETELCQ